MDSSPPYCNGAGSGHELRVCHVIDMLRFGGAERTFVNVLNALSGARRYALIIKDAGPEHGLRPQLAADIRVQAMHVRLRYAPLNLWRMVRWLRAERIDVVHAHMYWPSLYATLAARLAGVPVVVTTDHGISHWKRPYHRWIERLTINRCADRRLAVSPNVMAVMRDRVRVPPALLAPVANATQSVPVMALADRRPVRLCAIGRFVWQKDFPTLIEAAAVLRERGVDFRLSLAGDGRLREEIGRCVRERGLESHVELCGMQTDVDGWMREQDIFVLSSVEEGQPMVILEAMMRGLPIVATRVGGIPETLRDELDALLVAPRDPQALADAIVRLVDDLELRRRLAASARERALAEFSIEALARQHMRLYADILREKGLAARSRELAKERV